MQVAVHDGELPLERMKPIAKVTGDGTRRSDDRSRPLGAPAVGIAGIRPFLVAASPQRAVVRGMPSARTASTFEPRHDRAEALLSRGGGVLRVGPSEDPNVTVVAACLTRGPVLVVVPALDTATMLAGRLRRAGVSVALSPGEWAQAHAGADVVIGTRTAVWAPCPDLASIVVFDEHDERLQEERSPTWHARDVAIERARRASVPVLLVSPVPSVTALTWAGAAVSHPSITSSRAAWPFVDVIDRTRDEPWQTSMLTSPLIAALRDERRRIVCVHNAKGRARLSACRTCKALARCERCEAAVREDDAGHFHCDRCGLDRPLVCAPCMGTAFANLRPGIARLREEIAAAANRDVVVVSGDDSDVPADADVYVGTEAVLHRVRRADVVAFLDFDAELLAPRYRAGEQAMALVVRAARLVGARDVGGRVMLQTFLPRHEVVQAALLADPERMSRVDAARRRELGLPPFAALATIRGAGSDEFAGAPGRASRRHTPTTDGTSAALRAATSSSCERRSGNRSERFSQTCHGRRALGFASRWIRHARDQMPSAGGCTIWSSR
ncbi:MAG: hypothetical protein WKF58_01360 [Ilumatobacteraceae bacterium]